MKNIIYHFFAAFCFATVSILAHANDSAAGDRNGSIIFVKQPDVNMDSERLTISKEQVKVEYVFTNTSSKDITVPIVFPMPAYYFGISDHIPLTDFKAYVNGTKIATNKIPVVLLDEKEDITKKMAALGWSIKKVTNFLSEYSEFSANEEARGNLPAKWFDKEGYARFTLHDYYMWDQHFPAHTSISITHTYDPGYSSGIPLEQGYVEQFSSKEHCMSTADTRSLLSRGDIFEYAVLEYILKTGANWKGPIKDFHLIIQKEIPTEEIHLCFDGDFKKTSDRTFEFRAKNYVPKQDLNILFIKPEKFHR